MALTEKQKTFAALLAKGEKQLEAYRAAYNPANPNDATVRAMASREANKPVIKEYVNHLTDIQRQELALSNTGQVEYIKCVLLERIEICRKSNNETALARYIDILNKMLGTYHYIDVQDDNETELKNMSVDELKALLTAPVPSGQ